MFALQLSDVLTLAMPGLGIQELVIIAIIVLVLFGSRLPSVMRSLGSSVVSFKKGMKDAEQEDEDDRLEPPPPEKK